MRSERNSLDLNNLPEDCSRDGKQASDQDTYSSGFYRKKKSSTKDGEKGPIKYYECRFCSLKFCKSQALGGHMNRHRQERDTETLNKARQLVFTNNLVNPGNLGFFPGSMYPTRPFPTSTTPQILLPPPSLPLPVTDYFLGHTVLISSQTPIIPPEISSHPSIGAAVAPQIEMSGDSDGGGSGGGPMVMKRRYE